MSIWATIEIPEGSKNKYELSEDGGIILDWVAVVPFPANYGSISGTLVEDGDELDVLVVTDEPLVPLVKVEIRPIGCLQMIDNHEVDYKVIAVATQDRTKADVKEVEDIGSDFKDQVQTFFQTIKDAVNDPVDFEGWLNAEQKKDYVQKALENFN